MKLMNYLATVIASFLFLGCVQQHADNQSQNDKEPEIKEIYLSYSEIEIGIIDGCQYIIYKEENGTNLAYGYMAHKGNCNNPVHTNEIILGTSDSLSLTSKQLIVDANIEY